MRPEGRREKFGWPKFWGIKFALLSAFAFAFACFEIVAGDLPHSSRKPSALPVGRRRSAPRSSRKSPTFSLVRAGRNLQLEEHVLAAVFEVNPHRCINEVLQGRFAKASLEQALSRGIDQCGVSVIFERDI